MQNEVGRAHVKVPVSRVHTPFDISRATWYLKAKNGTVHTNKSASKRLVNFLISEGVNSSLFQCSQLVQ